MQNISLGQILTAVSSQTLGGYNLGGDALPLQTPVGVLSILVEAGLHHNIFPFFCYSLSTHNLLNSLTRRSCDSESE